MTRAVGDHGDGLLFSDHPITAITRSPDFLRVPLWLSFFDLRQNPFSSATSVPPCFKRFFFLLLLRVSAPPW
jgi:hypothetical protein